MLGVRISNLRPAGSSKSSEIENNLKEDPNAEADLANGNDVTSKNKSKSKTLEEKN